MSGSSDAQSILGNNQVQAEGIDAILGQRKSVKVAADVGGNGERGKLRGLHKELFDLIGGRAPIAETTSVVKAKVRKGPATKWDWRKFTNQARKDGLQLSHWVKADEPADKVYSFSKFNKLSRVPEYKRDDYLRLLADDNWSEEETTGLFELCRQFDLRFIVVHDHFKRRFPAGTGTPAYPARTVENLKARYYTVWTKLSKARNEVRKVRTTGVDVTYRYDAQHETMRKEQLTVLMGRTIAQIHEETQLRNDMKKIKAQEAQREKMTAPKREASDDGRNPKKKKKKDGTEPARGAAAPREVAHSARNISRSRHPFASTHLRSAVLEKPLQLKPKIAEMVANKVEELGVSDSPLPSAAVAIAYEGLIAAVTGLVGTTTETAGKLQAIAQLNEKKARLEGKRMSRIKKA